LINSEILPPFKAELRKLFETQGDKGVFFLLHSFYRQAAQDILIGFFFDGKDLRKIAEMQFQFLKKNIGLSDSYTGKPPAAAHDNLAPILEGHFDRRTVILRDILEKNKVPQSQIEAWIQFESFFRNAIVK